MMTKIEYVRKLAELYYAANLSDTDNPDRPEWMKGHEAATHCRALEVIVRDMGLGEIWGNLVEGDCYDQLEEKPVARAPKRPTRPLAYIPDGLKRKLAVNQFGQHEYWGSDFAAGKTTVGVFRDERFNYTAVWSYGDWADFGFNRGDEVDFQHTQTGRKKTLIFCGVIRKRSDAADFESESALMAQWTLK